MDKVLDIVELSRLLRQKWYWILILTLIGIGAAHVITVYLMVPQYRSETKLIVSQPSNAMQEIELGEIETNIQMINTYRDIIQDPVVLNEVQSALDYTVSEEELRNKMEIVTQSDSQIFGIQVVDSDPRQAALIADTIANVFRDSVGSIIRVDNVAILSPARVPSAPVSPHYLFNIVIGALTGIIGSIVAILIAFVADKKVHDEDFSTEHLGWLQLGVISSMSKKELVDAKSSELLKKKHEEKKAAETAISRKEPNHV